VKRRARSVVGALCALSVLCALGAIGAAQEAPIAKRVADRLAALRREADDLAKQEKTILTDLRKLEIQRQIKIEELAAIEKDVQLIRRQIADTTARASALRATAESQEPEVEERLVRLYKMGRAGYWRLLLDVDDLQSMGRAYRTAAALAHLDRKRVQQHEQTLEALERERATLEARARDVAQLQARATIARAELDQAVASRAALVESVESRRDVAAKLAAELDAAHLRLQATLAQKPGAAPIVGIPIRPFRGDLPWPANGIVIRRFGADNSSRVSGISFNRNGIELSLAEGRPVAAIHEGTVTHAGPFTAYGQLVIIEHGGGAISLYGHLAATDVNKGDRVAAGARVGLSGRNPAGNPSLYFELRIDGKPVDPLQWLRRQP
jgi:septal ring factor EnvC (AmiA/AmiB activator)